MMPNTNPAFRNRYLIACTFPPAVDEQVRILQREIKTRFGPSRSLAKPVHITLVPPFLAPETFETDNNLEWLAAQFAPFELGLEGIGCFPNPKSPVLYVQVMPQPELARLYKAIKTTWQVSHYPGVGWLPGFHPHVTIAYRDVKPVVFKEIWPEFKDRPFSVSCMHLGFTLFRWQDQHWKPVREFLFK